MFWKSRLAGNVCFLLDHFGLLNIFITLNLAVVLTLCRGSICPLLKDYLMSMKLILIRISKET